MKWEYDVCYFNTVFYKTDAVVATIVHCLKNPIFGDIDFLAGTGLSGTMILIPIAQHIGINIVAIRKREIESHGEYYECSEYPRRGQRYVIIDDFIESGGTVRKNTKRSRRS